MGSSGLFKMKVVAEKGNGKEGECGESKDDKHDVNIGNMQHWTRSRVPAQRHVCWYCNTQNEICLKGKSYRDIHNINTRPSWCKGKELRTLTSCINEQVSC